MITEELLKECRLEFETYFQSLIIDSHDSQREVESVREHSLRVANNTLLLGNVILQKEEDKHLAEIIALFHDLGKASMIARGLDSPAIIQRDHASESVKLVQKMDCFSGLPIDIQTVICKAIESHNKHKLSKLENEQQTLFARLLCDANKLDIFESSYRFFKEKSASQPLVTLDLIKSVEVSEKIIKSVMSFKSAAFDDMRNLNDYKLLLLSMVFDLNFKYTFRVVSEKQYIQKIYETLPKRDPIIDAYRGIKLFVENKFVS